MNIHDDVPQRQEGIKTPQKTDVVLGGLGKNNPLATAVVLGGQDKYLATLFELFNSEAKMCNGKYYRLPVSDKVALIGKRRRQDLDDLKIKVLWVWKFPATEEHPEFPATEEHPEFPATEEHPAFYTSRWEFAGYLKHKGALFIPHEATYDPARCQTEYRAIAYAGLIELAKKVYQSRKE